MKSKKWCRHVGQIADPDPIIATAKTSELAALSYNPAFDEIILVMEPAALPLRRCQALQLLQPVEDEADHCDRL